MRDGEQNDPQRMVTLLDLGPRRLVQSFPSFMAFVERMTGRLTKSWVFVATTEKPPPGTTVRVELLLEDGAVLIRALGAAVETYDHESDDEPAGARVELSYVDPASAGMIDSLYRHASGWPQESDINFDRRPAATVVEEPPKSTAAAAPPEPAAHVPHEPATAGDASGAATEEPPSGVYEQEIARALEALEIDDEPPAPTTAAAAAAAAAAMEEPVEPAEPELEIELPTFETEPVAPEIDVPEADAARTDAPETEPIEAVTEPIGAVTEPERRAMEQALEELEVARALDRIDPESGKRRRPTTEGMVVPLPEADGASTPEPATPDWLDVPLLVDDVEPEGPEAPFIADLEPPAPAPVPPAPMPTAPPAPEPATATSGARPLVGEQSAAIPTWATSATDEYDRERLRALSRVREAAPGPGPSRSLVGGGLLALVIAVGLLAILRSGAADRWRSLLGMPAATEEVVVAGGDAPATADGGGPPAAAGDDPTAGVRGRNEPSSPAGSGAAPPPAAAPPPVAPPPPPVAPPPPPVAAPPTPVAPPPPTATTPAAAQTGSGATAAREDIRRTVDRWREAWSEQRVDDYLDTYASSFRPANGSSHEAWAASRRERLLAPRSIEVETNSLSIELLSADRGRAWFHQIYLADGVRRQTWKSLEMERGPDGWKIRREQIERGPPPS